MRFLFVLHMPWSTDLGAPRIQAELADALRARGHEVDHFDLRRAAEMGHRPGLVGLGWFERAAREFLRERREQIDVVDAQQGPGIAGALAGWPGVLVTRSSGFFDTYADFELAHLTGSMPGRLRRRWSLALERRGCWASLRAADLAVALTEAEAELLSAGGVARVFALPHGFSPLRRAALGRATPDPGADLVVSIGEWGIRKGAADWPQLIARVRRAVPDCRFHLLGTGPAIRRAPLRELPGVTVVEEFASEDLPGLLNGASVAVFPTYVEGQGIGLLECLAAGLPAVAYDVIGPRESLDGLPPSWLVPAGDVSAMAARVVSLLNAPVGDGVTAACRARAADFDLDRTVERYLAAVGAR